MANIKWNEEKLIKYYLENISIWKNWVKMSTFHKKWYDTVWRRYKDIYKTKTVLQFIENKCNVTDKKDKEEIKNSKKSIFWIFKSYLFKITSN